MQDQIEKIRKDKHSNQFSHLGTTLNVKNKTPQHNIIYIYEGKFQISP